jgi:hypothetical protein
MPTFLDAIDRYKHQIMLLVYLPAVTILIFVLFSGWGYDDPYITYRFANNLVSGEGFVYNPGERILSTTTPLFALRGSHRRVWRRSWQQTWLERWGQTWETPLVGWTALLL